MIDNETPVLRKEDLIDILEALFKFSQAPNNAFTRKEDGLFVLDFYQAFKDHIDDSSIHATNQETGILKNFSLVDDILCYKGEPIVIRASKKEGNAIVIKDDGIYIKDMSQELQEHFDNTNIHVTAQDKENWNKILELAKKYADDLVNALVIYDYAIIDDLDLIDPSLIKPTTVYCVQEQIPDSEETYLVRYLYREGVWIPLDITKETYKLFARKKYVDDTFFKKEDYQNHDNKTVLDKFTEDPETHRLLYNNVDILDVMQISDDPNNAIFRGSDDKLYVKDLSSELESIARQASLSKVVLLEQNCNDSGIYELEEDISNFNFLMIHYYLMPDDPNLDPYDAKMEMVDVDGLLELYNKHIDYMLEHDYGISTYNTKIRFIDGNKLQVTYYNHVCVYKIIGVR
jgi:hypothetical protein